MFVNITIRTKLLACFALLTLFVLGLGAFGVSGSATINDMMLETQNRDLPKTQAIGDINDWAGRYTITLFRYILNGRDAEAAKALEAEAAQRLDEIARVTERYERFPKTAEEQRVFASFKSNWAAYIQAVPPLLDLARQGEFEQARKMVDSIVSVHRKRVLDDAKQLYVFAKEAAAQSLSKRRARPPLRRRSVACSRTRSA